MPSGIVGLSTTEIRFEGCPFPPPLWSPGAFDSDGRLRRLERFVRRNFSKPISLGAAAHQACLARCYFSTYFRRKLGIGFHQWLTWLRVNRAARDLVETQRSVAEIAWAVGFRDMTTFARSFRRVTGTTPSGFRQREVGRRYFRRTVASELEGSRVRPRALSASEPRSSRPTSAA